jgi:CheY-like chemotaxis protein
MTWRIMEIRIGDNGIGIPPDVKEKMFNPFFATKPAGEGTGLGLSISHDIIVKQHGGSIEVDTRPGEFTEIRIVLPRAAVFLTNRVGACDPYASIKTDPKVFPWPLVGRCDAGVLTILSATNVRDVKRVTYLSCSNRILERPQMISVPEQRVTLLILVVDDEPDVELLFRQHFRRDLREGRFTMEFAQSGDMALRRITDAAGVSLVLILSDINMPGMTGLELLPKAKAARPDVPVIIITAYGDADTKRKALESGAEALFTKPIDFLLLRNEIDTRVKQAA